MPMQEGREQCTTQHSDVESVKTRSSGRAEQAGDGHRLPQNARRQKSAGIIWPSSIAASRCQITRSIVSLVKITCPSAKTAFTPPGCGRRRETGRAGCRRYCRRAFQGGYWCIRWSLKTTWRRRRCCWACCDGCNKSPPSHSRTTGLGRPWSGLGPCQPCR